MTRTPTVYLAGPAVFHPAAKAVFDYLKDVCAEHGLAGLTPLDNGPPDDALPPARQAAAIRQNNIALIQQCDGVIACISPFRGPGADAGTAWEMGYAEALGKPVIPWCESPEEYMARVPHDQDQDERRFCKQHGMIVEDFGLVDNLMMTAGHIPAIPDFTEAVKKAAQLLIR